MTSSIPQRPTVELIAGTRIPLSLRVTPDVRASLDAAAALNGRSLSQEAEFRLERSFRDEWVVGQIKAAITGTSAEVRG